MPDLLLELFSEEIPARMQPRAAADLQKLVTDALVERGFVYEGARSFATPRRLTLHVAGLPAKGQDVREEKKGPRVGAPDGAVQGFLKSAGLSSIDEAKIESDPKKGEFYVAVIEKPGQPTLAVLAEILPQIIKSFPWPKSMRWGEASRSSSSFRWVRPLRAIVATFGPETEDPEIVPFEVDGIAAGDITYGHRFMAPEPIRVKRLDDYVSKLEAAKVIVDPERRKDIIRADARNLAFAQGLELVEDEALVEEVAGLVEWPVVLMGEFEESFLDVPAEAIRATIRANQKCFVLRDAKTGKLTNRFLATANVAASDGGATIIAGNGRVIRARLSDAKFFWETDKKIPLDERAKKLDSITFHAKLGTQGERVKRIAALARELAPLVGADPALAERAAKLVKADLVTEMVGEFPELQGLMGRYYAALQSEEPSVAAAIEEHYKPQGPSDRAPSDPVSIAVALADKLDTLVGFWAIDEKPTGSKDPYALRRAALGVIRIILINRIQIPLEPMIRQIHRVLCKELLENGQIVLPVDSDKLFEEGDDGFSKDWLAPHSNADDELVDLVHSDGAFICPTRVATGLVEWTTEIKEWQSFGIVAESILSFFHDRLKVQLREQGARHDLVDAVLSLGATPSPLAGEGARRAGEGGTATLAATPHPSAAQTPSPARGEGGANDDLLLIVRRVEALGAFLETEDGKNLLAGFKRAANILRAEEKKDDRSFDGVVNPSLLSQLEEIELFDILGRAKAGAADAVAREDFAAAMTALAAARPAVDAFFEKVTVNADQPAVRENRLRLLNELRASTLTVADFSKVCG